MNENRTEQLIETLIDLEKHLDEIQKCFVKWESPNISYFSFLNHRGKQRENKEIEKIDKTGMGRMFA
jgi:hypothetical protein